MSNRFNLYTHTHTHEKLKINVIEALNSSPNLINTIVYQVMTAKLVHPIKNSQNMLAQWYLDSWHTSTFNIFSPLMMWCDCLSLIGIIKRAPHFPGPLKQSSFCFNKILFFSLFACLWCRPDVGALRQLSLCALREYFVDFTWLSSRLKIFTNGIS